MPLLDAALRSWPSDPWLTAGLLFAAALYLRGWWHFFRRDPERWPVTRPLAFLAGLAAIFLALASPIEPFASLLVTVHMVQHLLLMMAAPPLIWLGTPLLPLIRGLPEPVRTYWVVPLFQIAWLRRFAARLTHPAPALVLFVLVTWGWHSPGAYDLALRSPWWHYLQHACFLGAGLLFWFPVVRPYPLRPKWPIWLLLPYLVFADVSNTVLSALLTFSDRVLYTHYLQMPRIDGGSVLDDQSVAGVLMWVPGSLAFLLPLFAIGIRLLFGETDAKAAKLKRPAPAVGGRIALTVVGQPVPREAGFDLLRVPVLGSFLKWRYARPTLQLPMLLLAIVVVVDGLTGPEVGAMNVAGVWPWIHWRGLLVLGLLVGGNFFCTACPFMLPRTIARKWLPAGLSWPRRLRGKWLAVGLLLAFFTAYEAFALWDRPRLTAWVVVAYFVAAFLVDGLFRGASFCKYVCPIGQFNFVQSLVSPLEVAVRDPARCTACKTKDCIRGRGAIPGCELGLFQPRKTGNMDCTFCLDCVHACPHDNIGVRAAVPGRALAGDPFRSGVGRFSQRPDLAALVVVLVFAAFVNAAGMVGPVLAWEAQLQRALGWDSPLPLVIGLYGVALGAVPFVAVLFAAGLCREWSGVTLSLTAVGSRFAFSLVPLGFGMWLAHYGYHLATSYEAAWPVFQRFVMDLGFTGLGEPAWSAGCCCETGTWLLRLELVALDVGLLLTLLTAHRIARDLAPPGRALAAFLPWGLLATGLFVLGVWILLQPMEMRGTMMVPG